VSLLALVSGSWFPVTHGFLYQLGRLLPSYWLVQAGRTALHGHGWGTSAWIVVIGWTIVLSSLAALAYRRDTTRVDRAPPPANTPASPPMRPGPGAAIVWACIHASITYSPRRSSRSGCALSAPAFPRTAAAAVVNSRAAVASRRDNVRRAMSPHPVRAERARRTVTTNAVMTTLASPIQGDAKALSMWRAELKRGAHNPCQIVDSEQIWHVTHGRLAVAIDGSIVELRAGDSLVVPEAVSRNIIAVTDAIAIVCGFGDAQVSTPGEPRNATTPPWIA
jgi:quercetin dioxygenase-like cupin family protein